MYVLIPPYIVEANYWSFSNTKLQNEWQTISAQALNSTFNLYV